MIGLACLQVHLLLLRSRNIQSERGRKSLVEFYYRCSALMGIVILQFHIKGGHFIKEDVALFDAAFFNFSADVAAVSYFCGVCTARL